MRAKELALLTTEIRFKSSAICNLVTEQISKYNMKVKLSAFLG